MCVVAKEEMHEQMTGYKRMRREHQSALLKLEEKCKMEMENHKSILDREYEALLGMFSRDLEKLQVGGVPQGSVNGPLLSNSIFFFQLVFPLWDAPGFTQWTTFVSRRFLDLTFC